MKKQLVVTGLIASLAILSASSARAFQSKQVQVVVASATTGGSLQASFTPSLVDTVNTGNARTKVEWVSPQPQPAGGWQIANTALKLAWNVTDVNGGIQIYTDNMNSGATPRFVDPTYGTGSDPNAHNADSNPAGLMLVSTGATTTATLPVAWSVKGSTVVIGGAASNGLQPADPDTGNATGPANRYQWLYMKDKNTPSIDVYGDGTKILDAFANADPFVTVMKQSGIHGAQGPTNFFADADHVSYVYFQGDFTTAAALSTYQTNKLTVEAFVE
jgi:hypothetical protein